ncbi:MAG TPA: hypothetical protein VN669_14955 [Candidatus Acidoferrales bacterium]|nr:hypothetical protein [Candidatus Acidoferrales bacterium]
MAGTALGPTSATINFSKDFPFRSGSAGIQVTAIKDPAIVQAITGGQEFPPGDIQLLDAKVTASTGQDIVFDSGQGKVTFSADGGVWGNLGLYQDPSGAITAMQLPDDISGSFSLPKVAGQRWLIMRWGYDAEAAAKGAIALQAASVQFGSSASTHGKFAIISLVEPGTKALTAIGRLMDSWILPSRVTTASDIEPGTCIISELDGQVAANVGITYGYNFSWVREAKLAGLTGDIGLKIALGVSATLGLSFSGSYAIVLSRENSDPQLRLRLFKQRKQGLSFAFDAGAVVQPSTGSFLPGTFEEFTSGVLGIHGQQLVKDLTAIESWAGGQIPLSGLLSGLSPDYVNALLTKITGVNAVQLYEQAREKLLSFLSSWGTLDSKVSSLIWSYVGRDSALLGQIKDVATKFAGASSPDDYAALLNAFVKGDFLSSEAGQFLENLALGAVLNPIQDTAAFTAVKKAATTASKLLDETSSEGGVLKALHDFVDPRIGIDKIKGIIDQASFDNIDEWLKAKLSKFLDETVSSLPQVQKVQKTINLLTSKAQTFYDQVVKALNDKYTFSLSALYERNSTDQALFDVEFDFRAGLNPSAQLKSVLKGDFADLFFKASPGVTVHSAAVSHELQRHSHIDVKLPFYNVTIDHVNDSIARISAGNGVTGQNGSLSVFDLTATDTVSEFTNHIASQSALAIAGTIPPTMGNQTRSFGNPGGLSYSYSFRQAADRMNRAQLEHQLRPYVDEYLPGAFGEQGWATWLGELDDAMVDSPTNTLGTTLVSLELSFPPDVMAGWLKAQKEERWFPYMQMSENVQTLGMKKIIPFYYFSDPNHYKDLDNAYTLLAYAAIPGSTSARLDSDGTLHLSTNEHVYWDWMVPELRRGMLNSEATKQKIRAMLPPIYVRLQDSGLAGVAKSYKPGEDTVRSILASANSAFGQNNLLHLLQVEAEVVQGCLSAGQSMAQFMASSSTDIKAATRALQKFGSSLADTFNNHITSIYGGQALRPLGTAVYLIAAQTFLQSPIQPSALFELIILKQGSRFALPDFVNGQRPPRQDVRLDQPITNA